MTTDTTRETPKVNAWLLGFYCFTAALGGLLFGFDTVVINGTYGSITRFFSLSQEFLQGWAVSAALLGCMIGALTVGKPGDIFGRKAMLKVLAILFFATAMGAGLAQSFTVFIIARFVGGLAIGGASVIAPMYISEIAPARLRGRLVAISQLAIVTGILLAFLSNYLLEGASLFGLDSWRLMYLVGGAPALIFFILLFFVVQSPRWLVIAGRNDEARAVIQKLNPGGETEQEMTDIVNSINKESLARSVFLFKKPYLRLVLIGIAVGMFNQLTGINIVMYYSKDIFESARFSADSALMQGVWIGLTNLVFTLVAMAVIDKMGRKFLLRIGTIGMSVFLGLFAWAYIASRQDYTLLICLIGFIAFFAFSQGAVIWVLLSEMFPNTIRSRGSSIGSTSHWFFNFLFATIYPLVAVKIGRGYVFAFFAAATLASFFFFLKFLEETKGKSLEELEKVVLKT